MMGGALSVVLWIVVMELMPEALQQSNAWWVPALWFSGVAGGMSLDWIVDAAGKKGPGANTEGADSGPLPGPVECPAGLPRVGEHSAKAHAHAELLHPLLRHLPRRTQ